MTAGVGDCLFPRLSSEDRAKQTLITRQTSLSSVLLPRNEHGRSGDPGIKDLFGCEPLPVQVGLIRVCASSLCVPIEKFVVTIGWNIPKELLQLLSKSNSKRVSVIGGTASAKNEGPTPFSIGHRRHA